MQKKIHKPSLSGKLIFIWAILLVGLLFLVPGNLDCQETGFKFFKNYTYKEYDHAPQNWGMVQSKNGIIYVANHGGVLVYDGVSWRIIGFPEYATVRSLAIAEKGTLFIGGVSEIGYLAPGPKGSLKFESLLNHIDENHKNFSNVWRTHATKQGVYFRTTKFLFRWDSGKIKEWQTSSVFWASFVYNKNFFVQQRNIGLMQMKNDLLVLIPGGEAFKDKKICMMEPYDTNTNAPSILVGTRSYGIYLYDGKSAQPLPTEVDDYLRKSIVDHGIRLSSGDFALATRLGGLVIIDPHGRLKSIYDKTSGLQDDNVKYLFQDNQENLWLCMESGISKIEYASHFNIYDNRVDLSGIVLSVVRSGSDLYVGTTKGLYVLHADSKDFRFIAGIFGNCWSLLSIDDLIFAGTSGGVFQLDTRTGGTQQIIADWTNVLLQSKHYPGRIWCGTKSGLVALIRKNNQWLEERRFENIKKDIQSIAETRTLDLWLGTAKEGVVKVDFSVNINYPVTIPYSSANGLPEGEIYAARAAEHVIFATSKGIFQFDEKRKEFISDKTLGPRFVGSENSPAVFRLVEDENKNIWFHSKSRSFQAIPGPMGSFTIHDRPLLRLPTVQVNTIYPDSNEKYLWFGSVDGLIRYNKTFKKNYKLDIPIFIQEVVINRKPSVFYPYQIGDSHAIHDFSKVISYNDRNLRFKYAAPFFENESATQYRYLLEGFEDDWSDWTLESKKDYTNLDSGGYNFKFQARNVYEVKSREGNFRFRVLAPWYKKWWAFIAYGIILLLLMFFVVEWRSRKLEQDKQKLEGIIKERTKEINDKNQQLENQTIQLKDQSEKLKEMDQLKSRFFANISHEFRTPLTLIMSPLEQMIADSRDKEQKKKFKVMRRSSQRLLTLINQLLDLSRFDSGKMKLQTSCQNIVPFLKGMVASFHMVAVENQLELVFLFEEGEILLYFDPQKMEEVMYNLLINAIKFTPAGGKISVSVIVGKERQDPAKEEVDFVYISIRDTGPGISQEQLAHIFDRFYQAEGFKGRGHKGTGIGLALAKEIVLMHYGKIDVHSQEGKGTEFVIQLPMGRDHLKPGEIVSTSKDASGKGKCKEIEILHVTKGVEEEEDSRDTGEVAPMGKVETDIHENEMHQQEKNIILVVEDEFDVRDFIRAPLEPFYTVVEAKDGQEGIAKAKEIIPDLIVSDIMMPGTDGYELCRVLKKDINTSHIPIILLTAKASEESIIQGLETGADDYITKPFNTRMLLHRIKNLIDLRRQLQLKIQRKKMLLPAEISVSSPDEKFLKEFQGIIEKNLSDPDFNVDVLSRKLIMGRSTLYRKIQALTGETPNQFILSYRLERGAQLLKENFGNITEVAFEVGFSSAPYFSKLFKEKFHQTPSEFQASHGPTEKASISDMDHLPTRNNGIME